MLNFLTNYLFEMLKFREITSEGKILNFFYKHSKPAIHPFYWMIMKSIYIWKHIKVPKKCNKKYCIRINKNICWNSFSQLELFFWTLSDFFVIYEYIYYKITYINVKNEKLKMCFKSGAVGGIFGWNFYC